MEKQITIAGQSFVVNLRYTAGHILTEGEAAALNQTFCENVRNNMAKKVKDGSGQDEVSTYANEYEFTVAGVASERKVFDPIEREARKIARVLVADKVKAHFDTTLAKYFKTDTDEGKAAREAKIDEVAGIEAVLTQAKKNVAMQRKALDSLSDDVSI
jgi:hypothetical protein